MATRGLGGLANVAQTVAGYERAGAAAIQLEDQEFPKRCGHTRDRRVIDAAEMQKKIKIAASTRDQPGFYDHCPNRCTDPTGLR